MIVHPTVRNGDMVTIRFDAASGPNEITIRVPVDVPVDLGPDPALAALWMPAMAMREELVFSEPVSPMLLANATTFADIVLRSHGSLDLLV
ncbi:MAG TPA: hypothetical protein PLV68_04345, partial [Ilumatobacteraceae bacterium]|nr:hypothetical protein [Ilumatobacteraceae bacterium]